jgi:HEPN domain-containing protein
MPTRNELKKLARLRLKEAETLFAARLYDGAVYLCGYAVEFALKARICRLLGVNEYPSSGKLKSVYAVHDFNQLLLLSGLQSKLDQNNVALFSNWSIATPWTPERRYSPKGTYSRADALQTLDAVRDNPNGVLRWIMRYW